MRLRNNIFAEAFRWLKKNVEGIKYQKDLAARIGVSEDTITRIMRDQTEVTDDFLCKFNEAFDNVFNYQWLRGEDPNCMLAADVEYFNQHPEKRLVFENPHQSALTIDPSTAMNALIAEHVRLVNLLEADIKKKEIEMEERLADKETIIREKDARILSLERTISDKEAIIREKDARILSLERQLAAARSSDLQNYPFAIGAAEQQNHPKNSPL